MLSVAKVLSVAPIGFEGALIEVESHTAKGLPSLQIVGMGNKAIDEAKERVKSAIVTTLLEFPARKITINLAPAELPKDGSLYDLPIALSILVSSGQLQQNSIENAIFAGELALNGDIRPMRGAISVVEAARQASIKTVYLPEKNIEQASLIPDVEIIGVKTLKSLFLHLKGELKIGAHSTLTEQTTMPTHLSTPILDEIYGQEQAKRALVIAAAGHHNLLLSGPPGAGKTMLAKTLSNLLPALSIDEKIAITKLHSLAGEATNTIVENRPFRAPHHTSSHVALIGGGSKPKPGEISLAHLGVLFLDEIPEYSRSFLEALRQPLEDKKIQISRVSGRVAYPADFMLVATMNPCPCGYFGDSTRECTCTSNQILNYQKRLSGPLLDRIDMIVNVSKVSHEKLLEVAKTTQQHSSAIRNITKARQMQYTRYKTQLKHNSSLRSSEVNRTIKLSADTKQLLQLAAERLNLSTRSYFKVIKVARTIADLTQSPDILPNHLTEALQYRQNT